MNVRVIVFVKDDSGIVDNHDYETVEFDSKPMIGDDVYLCPIENKEYSFDDGLYVVDDFEWQIEDKKAHYAIFLSKKEQDLLSE